MLISDCWLLGQVEVLQEEALLRQQEVQTDGLLLAGLQKDIRPLLQQNSSQEHTVSTAQVSKLSTSIEAPSSSSAIKPNSSCSLEAECFCVCLCGQRTLSRQEDVLSTIQLEVQQVSLGLGPGLEELEQLRKSLDAVMQEVSATEALKEHLGKKDPRICLHKLAVTESVILSVQVVM